MAVGMRLEMKESGALEIPLFMSNVLTSAV